MHEAKLLYHRMFASEAVDAFLAELRGCANYKHRAKHLYENSINKSVEALHSRVGCVWRGRMGQESTPALTLFFAQYIQPRLDTEPDHPIQHKAIERLMQFMMSDPNSSSLDVALVRNIVTGKISRHPAGCLDWLHHQAEQHRCRKDDHEKPPPRLGSEWTVVHLCSCANARDLKWFAMNSNHRFGS